MRTFFLNSASVAAQCSSSLEIYAVVKQLVEALDYIKPALSKKRAELLFDSSLETNCLLADQEFSASVARVKSIDADLVKKWYLYTRNHSISVQSDLMVSLSKADGSSASPLNIPSALVGKEFCWVSFGSCLLGESSHILINSAGASFTNTNAFNQATLASTLPTYQSSDKHRKDPYFDHVRGEHVAAMPLDCNSAQELLLCGIRFNDDYFGYRREDKNFYRFKLTVNNIFHGFVVPENEVSHAIRTALLR